eukprot:2735056-Rhodomonas_salina.1
MEIASCHEHTPPTTQHVSSCLRVKMHADIESTDQIEDDTELVTLNRRCFHTARLRHRPHKQTRRDTVKTAGGLTAHEPGGTSSLCSAVSRMKTPNRVSSSRLCVEGSCLAQRRGAARSTQHAPRQRLLLSAAAFWSIMLPLYAATEVGWRLRRHKLGTHRLTWTTMMGRPNLSCRQSTPSEEQQQQHWQA